jgi:hypothetical protein
MAALSRLTRMSGAEIGTRAIDKARTAAEAIQYATGFRTWGAVRLRDRNTRSIRNAVLSESRFVIDPARWSDIAAAIRGAFPAATADAVTRGSKIAHGRYDILGYRDLTFSIGGRAVDWHLDPVHGRRAPLIFWSRVPYLDPRVGDHKIIWELNRHQHWLTLGRAGWLTGDRLYARAFEAELASWMKANPPFTGVNWSSMLELAFRSISWLWALHLFAPFEDDAEGGWSASLIAGLQRQLDHIASHLSLYFSPNTHLLGEGLALYAAGRSLPALDGARRWEDLGRRVLLDQAAVQVNPDGGHAEASSHYHRYALDFYLFALAIAQKTRDRAARSLEQVTARLSSFCRAIADDSGRLHTIGDDDGGQLFPICGRHPSNAAGSLSVAAALLDRPDLSASEPVEEAFWMLGGDDERLRGPSSHAAPNSILFPDTGYAVLRQPGEHAIVDVGRHGFLNGGHAHADALSLVVSVGGRPWLIDPGTATYTMDPEIRDRFRSSAMHNTAMVDHRSQSEPDGPFHWRTCAHARVEHWRSEEPFEHVVATHDGFAPLVHRRMVVRAGGGLWIIADQLLGDGFHQMDLHWHLDAAWRPDAQSGSEAVVRTFEHQDGFRSAVAWNRGEVKEFFGGEPGPGWSSPIYGRRVPSPALRVSVTGDAPFSVVTALAAAEAPIRLSVESGAAARAGMSGSRTEAVVRFNERELRLSFASDASAADLHLEEASYVWHRRLR